jgi:hypothetical protein
MDSSEPSPATKIRAITDASVPPPWAQQLFTQFAELQTQLKQLTGASSESTPPVPYPPIMSADAVQRLMLEPQIPDFIRPLVKVLLVTTARSDDELNEASQAAYTSLLNWLNTQPAVTNPVPPICPMTNSPPFNLDYTVSTDASPTNPPRARSKSPAPEKFVNFNGNMYYKSSTGRLWNVRDPPPYPCRRCKISHWSWTACPSPPTYTPQHSTSPFPYPQYPNVLPGGAHHPH